LSIVQYIRGRPGNGRSGDDESLNLETALAYYGSKAQEVQDELAQDGEILSGMIGTSAHLVVAKDDLPASMQAVFDAPVLAGTASFMRGASGAQLLTSKRRSTAVGPLRVRWLVTLAKHFRSGQHSGGV